jgi:alpha-L-fucosidase
MRMPTLVAAAATILAAVSPLPAHAQPRAAGPGTNYAVDDPFTAARTAWWRDAKFGMFVHFGDYSAWGGEYTRPDGTVCRDAEWIQNRCSIPWPEYEAAAARFNPAAFDANAIVDLAKRTGQKYLVITSKHHDGYAMWPTRVNTWNLRDHSAFDRSRDILAELKQAADTAGIRFGLYYSITDWHAQDDVPKYKKDMYAQLTELVTNYHPATLWFDGQGRDWWTPADGEDLQAYLRGLDPNLIINDRVTKSRIVDGDHETPEREAQIPTAPIDGAPWEQCITTGNRWGWTRYDTWKPAPQLTRNLLDVAGRGGNLLLNIGPDGTGAVPPAMAASLLGIGRWINADGHAAALYGTDHTGLVTDPAWGAVTRKADKLYLSVYDWPATGSALHLTAADHFEVTAARVLGSNAPVAVAPAGDGFDLTPSGPATDPTATVVELTIRTPAPVAGHGTGLTARFWANTDFTGEPAVTRTDRTVNYAWREKGSPAPGIPVDAFAGRWTGSVQAQFTGPHTFLTVSDETVKVWVDGKVVIDNSTPHKPAVNKATVQLEAGRRYQIRVDYTERTGEAYLKLLWSSPNRRQRIIPGSQLYPS